VAAGKVRIYGDGHAKGSYISSEDVAAAVVASVDNPAASRKAIPIGGPRAYSQLEAVELVERATGKKLEREHMTTADIQAARSAARDPMSASFLGLFDALSRGDEVPTDWTRTLGVQPTSLEDWVGRSFGRPR
jgi:nucleoside-diphosphate-sugar epimerase